MYRQSNIIIPKLEMKEKNLLIKCHIIEYLDHIGSLHFILSWGMGMCV